MFVIRLFLCLLRRLSCSSEAAHSACDYIFGHLECPGDRFLNSYDRCRHHSGLIGNLSSVANPEAVECCSLHQVYHIEAENSQITMLEQKLVKVLRR